MNNNVGPALTSRVGSGAEESDYKWHKESNTGTTLKLYKNQKMVKVKFLKLGLELRH
jgi:hypothetical protein